MSTLSSPLPLNPIVAAIRALYGFVGELNDAIDNHVETLKHSQNPIIERTGRVLEAAKVGFGVGALSAAVILAAGQWILGNPLTAAGTFAQAVIVTNPVAMTCGAIGAIVYGYLALTPQERQALHDRLSQLAQVGVEIIRSMIEFVISKTKALIASDKGREARRRARQLRNYVRDAARGYGKSLFGVTRRARDAIGDVAAKAGRMVFRHAAGSFVVPLAANPLDDSRPFVQVVPERDSSTLQEASAPHSTSTRASPKS